jgi:nucleoid-associated protein YgaU
MSKSYCPFLYGKFKRFFQFAAIAVTLTAAGCAGSSDQSEEPVAAEGENTDAMAGEEGSGLIIEETEEVAETPEAAPESTEITQEEGEENAMMAAAEAETVNTDEYAATEETAAPVEETPAPAEETAAVEEAPESLDATLDDAVSAQPVAAESFEDTSSAATVDAADSSADAMLDEVASTPAMASTSSFGDSSGVLPPGVIASPGAAIFIKSKYEKSDSTASFNGGSTGGGNTYVVVPGDTVSGISRKIYGSFGHWKKIAAKNGISAPYILKAGTVIKYDADTSVAKAFKPGKHSSGANTVTVQSGDTLSKIASQVFGKSGSWKVLYDMNKDKISNPNNIFVGMVLSYNGGNGSVAKAKKESLKKKPAPVAKKAEEPAVVVAPAKAVEAAPVADEVPAAVVVEDETPEAAPVAEDETESTINVDLPTEEEE